MNNFPITRYGYNLLIHKLNILKLRERKKISQEIANARSYGDLKENAEYHAAKERQNIIEKKIKDLENKLAFSQLIDISNIKNDGKVVFGCFVKIEDIISKKKYQYQIVGDFEANFKEKKISIYSPLARALIGKYINNIVYFKIANKSFTYKIHQVSYKEN